MIFLLISLILKGVIDCEGQGVVHREGGGFQILDWNEYERGSRYFIFAIQVFPSSQECFYEHLLDLSKVFLSFEVLEGNPREMDFFTDHDGGRHDTKYRFTSDTLELSVNVTSEWKFCFVNRYSDTKLLYLYGSFYHPHAIGPTSEERNKTMAAKGEISKSSVNMIYNLEKIEENAYHLQQLNTKTASHEAVDTHSQESNQYFILKWSIIQMVIIIAVGVGQVFLVRHWFDLPDREKQRLSRIGF